MQRFLVLSLFLLLVGACDETTTGDFQQVDFTPTDCGMNLGCSFSDDLAVGGEMTVRAEPGDGVAVDVADLQSADPRIAFVDGYYGNDEWSVIGSGVGFTDLIALDAGGAVVDVIRIEVDEPTELFVDGHGQETPRLRAGEVTEWTADAGQDVELDVRPARFGSELMGNMLYEAAVSSSMAASMDFNSNPGEGRLRITAAEGLHDATFFFGDLRARVLLDVAAAPAERAAD